MSAPVRALRWDLLPRVGRAQVELCRLVAAHARGGAGAARRAIEAALAGALGCAQSLRPSGIDVAPVRDLGAALAREAPWVGVRLRRADGRALVAILDGALAGRLAARVLGGGDDGELSAPRPATLAERGVLLFLAALALDAAGVAGFTVDGAIDDASELAALLPDPWTVVVSTRLDGASEALGGSGRLRLLIPESLLGAPVAPPIGGARGLTDRDRDLLSSLPIVLRVVTGVAWPAAAEVATLAPRDVLLLDVAGAPAADRAVPAWLRAGRGGFCATLEGRELSVTSPFRGGPPGPDWNPPGAAGPGDPMTKPDDEALLRELPVEVTCEVARLTLTALDVLALGPGSVLPLGRPAGSAVELCAGGRFLARGELVDIDGQLGVRVLEMGPGGGRGEPA